MISPFKASARSKLSSVFPTPVAPVINMTLGLLIFESMPPMVVAVEGAACILAPRTEPGERCTEDIEFTD